MHTTAVRELSTSAFAVADRFPFWADVVTQALVPLECDAPDRAGFAGTIRHRRIGSLSVADVQASAMRANRTRANIARAPSDDMIIAIHVAGACQVGQGSSVVMMTENVGAAVATSSSYYFEFPGGFHQVVLKLPRRLFGARGIDGGEVVSLSPRASKLIRRLALATLDELDELSREEEDGIERAFVDLVQSSVSLGIARDAVDHAPRLSGAVEFIRSHLADNTLRPSLIAAHVSLSPRSLARLFAEQGTTIERTIWRERLSAARRDLSDPARANLSITEIAFDCGFNDLSHFTRRFSKAYGLTPRDYRAERRQMWIGRRN
jgi:AraC-like DNA-binding protein